MNINESGTILGLKISHTGPAPVHIKHASAHRHIGAFFCADRILDFNDFNLGAPGEFHHPGLGLGLGLRLGIGIGIGLGTGVVKFSGSAFNLLSIHTYIWFISDRND